MIKDKFPVCTVDNKEVARLKGLGFLRDKCTEDCFNCRVVTKNGKVSADFVRAVAVAADKFGSGEVAFTSRMSIEIQGIPYSKTEAFLSYMALNNIPTGGTGPKVRPVVSCKGTTCHFGLIDTFGLAEAIHESFFVGYGNVKLPHKFKIAVGGCPNNCVKPDINDIGIIGQKVPFIDSEKCVGCGLCAKSCPMSVIAVENKKAVRNEEGCNNCGRCISSCKLGAIDVKTQGYRMHLGGRWGKKTARGIPVSKIFESREEILSAIEKTILFYKEKGNPGERFADTISRIGFDKVEEVILSEDILMRKEEILKYE